MKNGGNLNLINPVDASVTTGDGLTSGDKCCSYMCHLLPISVLKGRHCPILMRPYVRLYNRVLFDRFRMFYFSFSVQFQFH